MPRRGPRRTQGESKSKPLVNGEGPLIAFVHVPKTAGATVKGMFANAYSRAAMHDAGNFFGKDSLKTGRRVIPRRGGWEGWLQNGGRVTTGHVPYGLLREHLPPDTRYLTFLREPVARVLSHYNRHFQRRKQRISSSDGGGRKPKKFESIEQGLVEMREPRLNNLATRLLCGDPSPPVGELPAGALDLAKTNLRDFMLVGITERFDESVALLQRRLDLEAVPCGPRQHVNPHSLPAEAITDRERALIEEHNQLDLELYAFAVELFEEEVARAGEGLAAEADTLRALNAAADDEAHRATQEACEWLERELPVGETRPVDELRAESAKAGIEKRELDRARRILEVERVRAGKSWARTPATTEDARDWLERELPVGATQSISELRLAAVKVGIDRRKLGRAAQLLGVERIEGADGHDRWKRVQAASDGKPDDAAGGRERARKRIRRRPKSRRSRTAGETRQRGS